MGAAANAHWKAKRIAAEVAADESEETEEAEVEPIKYDGQAAANAHWKAKRIAAEVAADEEGMPTLPGDEGEEGMPTMPGDEGDFLPGDEGEEGMPTMPESRSEKIQIFRRSLKDSEDFKRL